LYIIKNKFHTKNRGAPKSVGTVAIATFATIVNPALLICPHMHKAPSILAIRCTYKLKWKIQIFNERYYKCKKGVGMRSHPTTPLKVAQTLLLSNFSPNFFVRGAHKLFLSNFSPNFFVRGPHKLLHNSSRAGHPKQCGCFKICCILTNQQMFG